MGELKNNGREKDNLNNLTLESYLELAHNLNHAVADTIRDKIKKNY